MNQAVVNIVTALACEARFFIDKYRLTHLDVGASYRVYTNERGINLIVSGIGKIRSASATSYLQGFIKDKSQSCFLNAGIAGAATFNVGDCFMAHKIIDTSTQRAFFPLPVLKGHLCSKTVLTVDKPQEQYTENELVEMEAAGFYQAAVNLVSHEQIQILKIVSDNSQNSVEKITSQKVTDLFWQNSQTIEAVIQSLMELSQQEASLQPDEGYFIEFNHRFHFTNYQQYQLKDLIRRFNILFQKENPLSICSSAKESFMVIQILQNYIQNNAYADNLL